MAFDSVTYRMRHEKLTAKLRAMVPSVEKALMAASMAGAQDVAAYARALVPKDTGALAASIVAEAVPDRLGARVAAGGTAGTKREVRAGSGVPMDTAFMVEYGTKRHRNKGKFAGSWHPGAKASPFLYPAAKLNEKRNQRRLSRALSQAMKTAK